MRLSIMAAAALVLGTILGLSGPGSRRILRYARVPHLIRLPAALTGPPA